MAANTNLHKTNNPTTNEYVHSVYARVLISKKAGV